jgi:hypothetical protein
MAMWRLVGSTAVLALGYAVSAQAQVTPEEVWQNWQKLSASYGQALVADSVARNGDTLVVSGMSISMDQDGAKLNGKMDEVRFRDLGDGTVEVTMSDTYPIAMTMPGTDGGTEDLAITITQPGLSLIAGGSPTETSYVFSGPSVGIAVQASKDGKAIADGNATLTGMQGKYRVADVNGTSALTSDLEAQTLAFSIKAGEDGSTVDMTGNLAGLRFEQSGNFLGVAAMENMVKALRDGFAVDGKFSYGAGSFSIDATENGVPTKISATNETGFFNVGLNGTAMRYGAGGTGVNMVISGGNIPFPELVIAYGEAAFDFVIPVSKTDTPADFSFLTRIVDLTVSDEIWAMLDPTATLPRDPATLIVNTKGTGTLINDLMDEAAMAAMGDAPPGQLHSLEVTELTARFAGAELNGAGAFTFDNSDLTTFDGVPAPTGKIDLKLTGGNGLLDKLVAMGLIPQDQAMGARMMMAMFAKPGEGEDVLNSSLEFKDKGFFANGQRLK